MSEITLFLVSKGEPLASHFSNQIIVKDTNKNLAQNLRMFRLVKKHPY